MGGWRRPSRCAERRREMLADAECRDVGGGEFLSVTSSEDEFVEMAESWK